MAFFFAWWPTAAACRFESRDGAERDEVVDMTEITAAAVKSLRDRTGAGMMACKRALEEAGGDEERAIDILRQRGAAKAAKRAARETSEGVVALARRDETATMVEVTSETDFVARNQEFQAFAERVAEAALGAALPHGEVVEGAEFLAAPRHAPLAEELDALRGRIGENLRLARIVRYAPGASAVVGSYLHFGGRIGVLVEVSGVEPGEQVRTLARELAMHIAAAAPLAVAPDDIPEAEKARERAVLVEQAKNEGKPPAIAEKIVEGRMRKYYEQHALLLQPFVRDPDTRIEALLRELSPETAVRRFVRFEVGA